MLKLSPYCYPEVVSSTHMAEDLNKAFKKADIHTTVYAPTPCRGVDDATRKKFSKIKHFQMEEGSIDIYRFSLFREGKNPILRALRYILCNMIQYHKGKKAKTVDVVYSASTPPTQGILCGRVAYKLSKKNKRKIPYVYNLQDIFPDSLVISGMTKRGSLIWKIGRKIEDYTYSHADKIIVISEGFKRNIMAKGVAEDKIVVVSNWVDLDAVKPVERKENRLFDEFSINRNKFVVLYAGNMGEAQGTEVIIEAAKELLNYDDIQFMIFGGGSRYLDIKDRVKKEKINNVIITELLPLERVSEVYSMGDVALITCKPGMGNAGLPSKTWSIMACNTPIISSFDIDGDLSDVIRDSGAGVCVAPGNSHALAEAILEIYSESKLDKSRNVDIRGYALKTASKDACVQKYVDTIVGVLSEKQEYSF